MHNSMKWWKSLLTTKQGHYFCKIMLWQSLLIFLSHTYETLMCNFNSEYENTLIGWAGNIIESAILVSGFCNFAKSCFFPLFNCHLLPINFIDSFLVSLAEGFDKLFGETIHQLRIMIRCTDVSLWEQGMMGRILGGLVASFELRCCNRETSFP